MLGNPFAITKPITKDIKSIVTNRERTSLLVMIAFFLEFNLLFLKKFSIRFSKYFFIRFCKGLGIWEAPEDQEDWLFSIVAATVTIETMPIVPAAVVAFSITRGLIRLVGKSKRERERVGLLIRGNDSICFVPSGDGDSSGVGGGVPVGVGVGFVEGVGEGVIFGVGVGDLTYQI
jgi:hypothetical protein